MNNHVPRRSRWPGGTLGSLGILLLLSVIVRAQEPDWQSNPNPDAGPNQKPAATAEPAATVEPAADPQIPPPFPPSPPRAAQTVSRNVAVEEVNENLAAEQVEQLPAGTKKYTLEECIQLALQYQPALRAASSSLGAAQEAYNGVAALPRWTVLLSRDVNIRRTQACLGIQAAQAGLTQAEWDTRYAVTRNFFTVIYARMQSEQVKGLVRKLGDAHKRGQELVDAASGDINQLDVDTLLLAKEKTRSRGLEAAYGVRKALDALHEAIGLPCDFPFDIVDDKLPPLASIPDVCELIALALSGRGELMQAQILAQIMDLEISAQSKLCFKNQSRTFASGADIHAQPIPQGRSNGEYVPGAIGPEYPTNLYGPRWARVHRAEFFSARASAVIDKTENLISLETKVAFWKWREAAERIKIYQGGNPKNTKDPSLAALANSIAKRTKERFDMGKVKGEEFLKAQGAADLTVIELNEALYNHALALIALERITAGGYRLFPNTP